MINLYFSFGIVSSLSASMHVSSDRAKGSMNILVVEVSPERNEDYKEIEKLIIDVWTDGVFSNIIFIEMPSKLSRLNYKNPIQFIFNTISFHKQSKKIENMLTGHDYKVFSPLTSRLSGCFTRKANDVILIEHGLGEYLQKKGNKGLFIDLFESALNYTPVYRCYSEFSSIVSLNSDSKQINYLKLIEFWRKIERLYPDKYKKIFNFFNNNEYVDVLIDPYEIDSRFRKLYMSNFVTDKVILQRMHPAERNCKPQFYSFSDSFIDSIPSEFFAYFSQFTNVKFVGTMSSSLFYAKHLFNSDVSIYRVDKKHYKSFIDIRNGNIEKMIELIKG
ncbi:polysialyltransferase family glycosyltransferase [Vibrio sp. VB16]|uniref:polysialyltransferase family glycosyltransferase n=1 Tax=Vibrio sp. VB16 TaxID=2785746 RepID=UPI0018A0AAA8|nr:polysialyltransferase family glycosyltransferase [Vibrio sp. VB16]UGA57356.1 alpha-2,8-polysialyltransferase family protein [Vibrio sp. VB16]